MSDAPPLVLHVIHHLVIGGMENGLVNLINHLPADRFRHAVACIEDYSDFRERINRADVEVTALHRSRIGTNRLRAALFQLCRRLRPAIVHTRNLSGLDALLPARLAGVSHTVHGEHGWDVDNLDGRRLRPLWLRRLHSPLIDRYIVVSKDLERFLSQRVGVRASRIRQIYNGVDTERFMPRPSNEDGEDGSEFRIGTVGRIQPVKDQATLLRAFASLMAAGVPLRRRARLVVVGSGPMLDELKQLAARLGVADAVSFEGSLRDVSSTLRSFDVFVLPSLNEGISNTILEAMASGIPVLATAVGGNVELVEDGVVGRLFQPGDAEGLARLLVDYSADFTIRRRHGEAARQRAVERFSLPAMTSAYGRVYDELLGRH